MGRETAARVGAGAGFVAALLLVAGAAHAELRVTATPVLGPNTPSTNTWLETGVRIDNDDSRPMKGTIELTSPTGYGTEEKLVTRAPFAVGAGATVTVRMPARGFAYAGGPLQLRVLGEAGQPIAAMSVPVGGQTAPFLLDVTEPPRLAGAIRDVVVPVSFDPSGIMGSSPSSKVQLLTGSVRTDPSTGDPVLPERAAGYAGATVVLMRSDQLARLAGPSLDALANFVIAGGSIAVFITRPEDLRNQTLASLVGGEVSAMQVPTELRRTPAKPPEGGADPGRSSGRSKAAKDVWPGEDLAKTLTGYSGGNLYPTLYGAAATYGLGEVHVLAFDPTAAPGVDDPWVRGRMVDLVRHAWDRRASFVTPHGLMTGASDMTPVRKELDPNENSRWAIIIAALLLTVYSVLAGPVNFLRASKQQRPLRALWYLPIYAACGLAAIVLLGIGSKGWTGKARHLTLVESAAGMSKASARRFRGFFTSASRSMTVRASDSQSVLDTALESRSGSARSLVVDRDGVRLVGVSTMPWETVVVREDGFMGLGAGVSVVREPDGDVTVVNRTARDMRAVVLVTPQVVGKKARRAVFFQRLKDGERVKASAGKELTGFTPWTSTSGGLPHSDLAVLRDDLDRQSRGLFSAWVALGTACGNRVDWWPDDAPVVLAQMDGGEGQMSDSSLSLERDRVLVRVIGWGGLP
ncbi:MAG: hypothetical protein HY898_12790 [Deltaproteobacteria bacterium]|nr:hypothetical protein [Deltaproteobacteria bacterium]